MNSSKTHERAVPDYCWGMSPRERAMERGPQRIVVIANRIYLPQCLIHMSHSLNYKNTQISKITTFIKRPIQSLYRLTKDKYPQTTLVHNYNADTHADIYD